MLLPVVLLAFMCLCGNAQSSNATCAAGDCDEPALVQMSRTSSHEELQGRRRRSDDSSDSRRRRSSYTGTIPYVLQAYCGDSWLTDCSDVPDGWQQHVGAFDPDITTEPPEADGTASDNYMTFGGSGVEGTLPSASTIEGWFDDSNTANLDFDMEGSLAGAFSTVATLTEEIQTSYPDAKAQVTCLVSTYDSAAEYKDTFDYFGIMIHGDSMTSGSYSIPEDDPTSGGTWPYIKDWIDSDIDNSKIVLSLTTTGLEGYMVDWFKQLIAEYGLAGMSFWYWDQLDDSISITCIEDQGTQCDTSDSFKCSATCNGGSADGYCCDTGDMTSVGNCSTLGQEGCCGGTDSTTYCQLVS